MGSWGCWGLWLGIGRTGRSDSFGGYLISHNAYYVAVLMQPGMQTYALHNAVGAAESVELLSGS